MKTNNEKPTNHNQKLNELVNQKKQIEDRKTELDLSERYSEDIKKIGDEIRQELKKLRDMYKE